MRGQDTLIALRRRGYRPARGVMVHTGQECRPLHELAEDYPEAAHLWIGPTVPLARLDLRCLFDLKVVVIAEPGDAPRAVLVAERCAAAQAKRAIAARFVRERAVHFDSAGLLAPDAFEVV